MALQNGQRNPTGPRGAGAAGLIEGKDGRLEVLPTEPLVLETPVRLLAGERITDKKYLFVRNIQDLARGHDHGTPPTGRLGDRVDRADQSLRESSFAPKICPRWKQVEHEMVLQCSGNGRNEYGGIKGTPGTGRSGQRPLRGRPAQGNAREAQRHGRSPGKYVTAEGHDLPMGLEKPDLEHSIPVADILERSILALRLNGETLPGIHGGPVRLVTPGLFGTMQVKWLARLRFETAESSNFYHATEYRVPHALLKPGEKFRFTIENSRPTWDVRLMSYILDPAPGAKLKAGAVTVSGVAYNDGTAPMESVLVSFDRGPKLAAGGVPSTRESLCLVSVEDAGDTQAWHLRDLGAGHRRSRPHPASRRHDLLEPERLRVDGCVQE